MKINIIRQDALKYNRVRLIRRINALITFGSIGLFAAAILYMGSYFVYLGFRQNSLTQIASQLTATYNGRAKEVTDYLAVKEIVAAVDNLQTKRFKYKEFLNAIYSLLPKTAVLASVDFGAPGVVVAGARLSNLSDYDVLVGNVKDAGQKSGFLFSAISEKQLGRGADGTYLVTLELKIK